MTLSFCCLPHLVDVEPALHDDDGQAGQPPDHELALVARGRAHGEVGDGAVGQDHAVLHQLGEAAEAGAADEAKDRADPGPGLDVVSDGLERLLGERVGTGGWAECCNILEVSLATSNTQHGSHLTLL